MKSLSFRKGTLVVLVPDAVAAAARAPGDVEFRALGPDWALRVCDLWGVGTYHTEGREIYTSGSVAQGAPNWWPYAHTEKPEPAWVAQAFGKSAYPVELGAEEIERGSDKALIARCKKLRGPAKFPAGQEPLGDVSRSKA
jgi:hypothetical protein